MNQYLVDLYKRYNVKIDNAKGQYLYDEDGERYLDFFSGIAVSSFGHCHPALVDVALKQLSRYWHLSNLFEPDYEADLSEKLCKKSGLNKVFFGNSGTEAIEAAIKFAKLYHPNRKKILHLEGSFHGRSHGAMSVTDKNKLNPAYFPILPDSESFHISDIEELILKADHKTLAIIIEPIQGENGIKVVPYESLKSIRKVCDDLGILLIVDEIQCGLGRSSKFFAYQWADIKPDIVTIAKSIANGLPLSATIVSEELAKNIRKGDHGSTFGGNPVSLAVANTLVDMIDDSCLKEVNDLSGKLFDGIKKIDSPYIKELRGKGFMIGIEFHKQLPVDNVINALLEKKVLTVSAGENVLRLLPPFIIKRNDIDYFCKVLNQILNS